MADAHHHARGARGQRQRQEVANGGAVIAERAHERFCQGQAVRARGDRGVAARAGERRLAQLGGAGVTAAVITGPDPAGRGAGGVVGVAINAAEKTHLSKDRCARRPGRRVTDQT